MTVVRDPGPVDERTLVGGLLRGDRAAAEELVERTYGLVYASLVRLCGDLDLASDLTQETYRKAWTALEGFDGRARFSTWLYRIAYNTFLNHLRRPRRLVPLDDAAAPATAADPEPSAEERLSGDAEAERLRRAVLALPEEQRFAVAARYWHGMAVREIAELEQVSTVAIRKRLGRALSNLARALGRETR